MNAVIMRGYRMACILVHGGVVYMLVTVRSRTAVQVCYGGFNQVFNPDTVAINFRLTRFRMGICIHVLGVVDGSISDHTKIILTTAFKKATETVFISSVGYFTNVFFSWYCIS